jgi:hypothetical protein
MYTMYLRHVAANALNRSSRELRTVHTVWQWYRYPCLRLAPEVLIPEPT